MYRIEYLISAFMYRMEYLIATSLNETVATGNLQTELVHNSFHFHNVWLM